MSRYRSGYELEREVRKLFVDAGFSVIRGAGSKGEVETGEGSMKADLVATRATGAKRDTVYLVAMQCKRAKIR